MTVDGDIYGDTGKRLNFHHKASGSPRALASGIPARVMLKKWESYYHFNKRDGDPSAPWAILYTNGSVKKRFKLFDLLPQGCFSFSQGTFGSLAEGIFSFQSSVEQTVRS